MSAASEMLLEKLHGDGDGSRRMFSKGEYCKEEQILLDISKLSSLFVAMSKIQGHDTLGPKEGCIQGRLFLEVHYILQFLYLSS